MLSPNIIQDAIDEYLAQRGELILQDLIISDALIPVSGLSPLGCEILSQCWED
jgi:hypothetical protein